MCVCTRVRACVCVGGYDVLLAISAVVETIAAVDKSETFFDLFMTSMVPTTTKTGVTTDPVD